MRGRHSGRLHNGVAVAVFGEAGWEHRDTVVLGTSDDAGLAADLMEGARIGAIQASYRRGDDVRVGAGTVLCVIAGTRLAVPPAILEIVGIGESGP